MASAASSNTPGGSAATTVGDHASRFPASPLSRTCSSLAPMLGAFGGWKAALRAELAKPKYGWYLVTFRDEDGATRTVPTGTDPKSQLSKFSVREIQRPGGAVTRIQWATVRGIRYRVTTSTDLGNWSLVVGSESEGTGAIEEIDISGTSGETKRFFRVEIVP